jgi:hypothetical protein
MNKENLGKNKKTIKNKKAINALQIEIDKLIPEGVKNRTMQIRTDNMSIYKKDADKFFEVFKKQLELYRNSLKIKKKDGK